MYKYSKSILFLIIALLVISCSEKKNNEQVPENRINRSEMHEKTDRSETTRSIAEVVEIWVQTLDERLKFDEKTAATIQKIYLDTYISLGGTLDDKLDREEALLIRQQIVRYTRQDILSLLNSDQQQLYIRFIKD